MLYGANEVELGKQWANNKLLTSLSEKQEFLGRLVLGEEDGLVKVFGATIF